MNDPQFRPVITVVRQSSDDRSLEVTLDMGGWIADGRVDVHGGNLIDAACRATCEAVTSFLPPDVAVTFSHAEHLGGEEWDKEIVFSSVFLRQGEEGVVDELLGAAFVRTDPQVAAVRATLDGLTRRLSPYVGD